MPTRFCRCPRKLEFYMALPLLARPLDGHPPKKIALGAWLLSAMKLLANGKVLRGTRFDPFGHSAERSMERDLITRFEMSLR